MRFCKKCKGTPEIRFDVGMVNYWVECFDCGYEGSLQYSTMIEAVSGWNRTQLIIR